jgi:hypothetical protein
MAEHPVSSRITMLENVHSRVGAVKVLAVQIKKRAVLKQSLGVRNGNICASSLRKLAAACRLIQKTGHSRLRAPDVKTGSPKK